MKCIDVDILAKNIDENLRSDDLRFKNAVFVKHQDGSTMFYLNAFVEKYPGWFLIFTEHHGHKVYNAEDIDDIHQLQEISIYSINTRDVKNAEV